ncbi:tetratricopeptide repeat protein [Pseudotamlana agarivorans]|uniref:tetratricopeptide repeat protein n=1 Tax=Pseudotamlana agarivorans TaxID=481183 RepID=UPI000832A86A|nr:tetratricopeptide repeat protein [Tamlana agarivorans]
MKPFQLTGFAFLLLLQFSCNMQPKQITSTKDYQAYLETDENKMLEKTIQDFNFWETKLEKAPNQFPYLVKASASQSQIFQKTGRIEALVAAENYLIKANEATHYSKAGYLRALARNYISQHKFKEALELLKQAESQGEDLKASEKMLFDVYMELGEYDQAMVYLEKIRKASDFDYLIRLSKWSDHKGNLDAAIKYLEQAKTIIESSNIPFKNKWIYTNLADFYGHAGEVEIAYKYYLKALKIDANDAYAKKGIAWIVYSHEKRPDEALRILNSITAHYMAPDYYLLKSEIAQFKADSTLEKQQLDLYKQAVKNPLYGDMYNAYNALLFAEVPEKNAEALLMALHEIENRPTPESYDLLAWTYFNQGDYKNALTVAENHIVMKTSEPNILFHLAQIYKANGKLSEAKALKKELLESTFELGPLMAVNINKI